MEEFDEVLESTERETKVPNVVKTLAIISYVGNSLYGLLFLAMVFLVETFKSMFVNKIENADLNTDQLMNIFVIVFVGIILSCIACIIGAFQMTKGRRWGFFLYAVANGLWAALLLYGGTLQGVVVGLSSIAFIVVFGANLKYMKR